MADKNKFPVIYVPVSDQRDEIVTFCDDDNEMVRSPWIRLADAKLANDYVVPYEPAVGRCETCAYFDEHQAMAQCNNMEGLADPRATDYCSRHEPKG